MLESTQTSQRARAYARFVAQVACGGIRAGQFLTQRELTTLLDTPLGAIREMIPRLEAGGLVQTVPQRGLQITPVDLKLIRNAFQIRAMVEREAAAAFVHNASDSELQTIEAQHQAILQRIHSTPHDERLVQDSRAVDWGLHERMVDALGNDIIADIYRVNSLRIRLIRLEQEVLMQEAMEEHLALIAAMRRRDAAQVRQMLDTHIASARDRVVQASLGQAAQAPRKLSGATNGTKPSIERTMV